MTKRCVACEFRTDHPAVACCQVCGAALAPTLLPPAGPIALHESNPVGGQTHARYAIDSGEPPKGLWDLITDNGVGLVVAFLVVMMLGLAAGESFMTVMVGPPAAESDSTGRVRVGTHVSELGWMRGADPGDPVFAPDSRWNGTIVYESDGRVLRVRFGRGRVTSVEEWTSNSGSTDSFKLFAEE